MAQRRVYVCNQWRSLKIGAYIKFQDGKFETDDVDLQKQVERSDYFGISIHYQDDPRQQQEKEDTEAEAKRLAELEEKHRQEAAEKERAERETQEKADAKEQAKADKEAKAKADEEARAKAEADLKAEKEAKKILAQEEKEADAFGRAQVESEETRESGKSKKK